MKGISRLKNGVLRAAFRNVYEYGGSSSDGTSISALIDFAALMKNSVESLAEFVTTSELGDKNQIKNPCLQPMQKRMTYSEQRRSGTAREY